MKKSKFTEEQITFALRQVEGGTHGKEFATNAGEVRSIAMTLGVHGRRTLDNHADRMRKR